jgi:hypothetical protein
MSNLVGPTIEDKDVGLLAGISTSLEGKYAVKEDAWTGSPFAWIKTCPSRQVGKIGELLIAGWWAAKGLDVTAAGTSSSDKVIHGYKIEVKFSTLWTSGEYAFQQIRDQDYQYLICLGISPFSAHCWVVPKEVLLQYVIGYLGQHTGKKATETSWIQFKPQYPPTYLTRFGGTLQEAYQFFSRLPHGPYQRKLPLQEQFRSILKSLTKEEIEKLEKEMPPIT